MMDLGTFREITKDLSELMKMIKADNSYGF